MSLPVIAIANAILWTGLFVFWLLRLMSQRSQIEAQIDRLEHSMDNAQDGASPAP